MGPDDATEAERGPRSGGGSPAGMAPEQAQLPERCRPIARVLRRMCQPEAAPEGPEGRPEGAPEGRPEGGERPSDGEDRPSRGGR